MSPFALPASLLAQKQITDNCEATLRLLSALRSLLFPGISSSAFDVRIVFLCPVAGQRSRLQSIDRQATRLRYNSVPCPSLTGSPRADRPSLSSGSNLYRHASSFPAKSLYLRRCLRLLRCSKRGFSGSCLIRELQAPFRLNRRRRRSGLT